MDRNTLRETANKITKEQFSSLIEIIDRRCFTAANNGYYYTDIRFSDHPYFMSAVEAWSDKVLVNKLMNFYELTTSLVITPINDNSDCYCTGIRVNWGKNW